MTVTDAAQPSQIEGATRLPFAEAIAYFRGKLGNLIPTQAWDDLWKAQHDAAFMVAGATEADLLADLAAAIDQAISQGTGIDEFRKAFKQIVAQRGWTGWTGEGSAAGVAWRTRIIYGTNTATAYAAGRLGQLQAGGFDLWIYRHNDSVLHPRPQHLAWNGLTLPPEHPFWRTHYPPNGWNCFPGETPVRCAPLLGLKAFYRGKMVEIHTALGNRLALTVNHQVLTRRGWVAAQKLKKGDQLVGAAGQVDAQLHGVVDDEQAPASAADLFESIARQGLRIVPVSAHDFDGDALGMEGEIHVAGADGVLMDVVEAAQRQDVGEGGLASRLILPVEPASAAKGPALRSTVFDDATTAQGVADGRFRNTKPLGDSLLADETRAIEGHGLALHLGVSGIGCRPGGAELPLYTARCGLDGPPPQPFGLGHAAQADAASHQGAGQWSAATTDLFGKLLEANPGAVADDEIIEIREYEWAGHVYDFVTQTGLILAGGLIVSNCRCYVVGARSAPGSRRLGGDPGKDLPDGWDAPDGRTGELPGIDKGWGYRPGGTVADTLAALTGKLQSLPAPLAKGLADDLARAATGLLAPPPPAP